jgi:hypothetical protein
MKISFNFFFQLSLGGGYKEQCAGKGAKAKLGSKGISM